MKSWRTTLGGVLAAVGAVLLPFGDDWVIAGAVLLAAGNALMGRFARDDQVRSEDVIHKTYVRGK